MFNCTLHLFTIPYETQLNLFLQGLGITIRPFQELEFIYHQVDDI